MSSVGRIKAVLFDLDGTLRHNHPSSEHTFFDIAAGLGVPDGLEKRRKAMRWAHSYWAQSRLMFADLETYNGLSDEFWENYAYRHLASFECQEEQARRLAPQVFCKMRQRHKPEDLVLPDVYETLDKLLEDGFTLGVVSNRMNSYLAQLETLELHSYFKCAIAAGEISAWKPEPEIFYHALRQLEIEAESAIYVGDNYYADVVGARGAGLRPVLFDPEGVFPDADCDVIASFAALEGILQKQAEQDPGRTGPK